HIKANRLDRRPFGTHFDAEGIDEAVIGRLLASVISLDAITGGLERFKRFLRAAFLCLVDFGCGYAEATFCNVDAVEFGSQLDQGLVPSRRHLGSTTARNLLHP